jgi:hypothetical protein
MIRNSMKLTGLAALALLGGAVGLNCSKGTSNTASAGHVTVALTLSPGDNINSVSYKIHAGAPTGIADVTGLINTMDPNATPSAYVSFTESTGDTVTLTADTTSTPPKHCVGTSMAFDVHAGQDAIANVTLVCGGGTASGTGNKGNVKIVGTVTELAGTGDNCPQLTSWTVSPLQTSAPGGTIDVNASATDADVGETIAYAWAPAAKFTAPTAQMTQYVCTVAGPDTITLSATDNHMPTPCTTSISFAVNCVSTTGTAGAGGGTAGAGGSSAGAGGSSAGAGGSSAGAGGSSAGAGGGSAGAGGSSGVITCTQCEMLGTQGATAMYQTSVGTPKCNNTSVPGTSLTDMIHFGCGGFTGPALTACQNLLSCLEGPTCAGPTGFAHTVSTARGYGEAAVNFSDPLPCLCGNINKGTCLGDTGGLPSGVTDTNGDVGPTGEYTLNGVCANQYRAAAASISTTCGTIMTLDPAIGPQVVQPGAIPTCVSTLQAIYDPATPLGVPSNLFSCNANVPCTCP